MIDNAIRIMIYDESTNIIINKIVYIPRIYTFIIATYAFI